MLLGLMTHTAPLPLQVMRRCDLERAELEEELLEERLTLLQIKFPILKVNILPLQQQDHTDNLKRMLAELNHLMIYIQLQVIPVMLYQMDIEEIML